MSVIVTDAARALVTSGYIFFPFFAWLCFFFAKVSLVKEILILKRQPD